MVSPSVRIGCSAPTPKFAGVVAGGGVTTVQQREAVHETRLDEGNEAADGDEEDPLVDEVRQQDT